MSRHDILCDVIICHVMSYYVTYRNASCDVIVRDVMSYYVTFCRDVSLHTMSSYVMSCHITSQLIMICHAMSYQVLSHFMLCHFMPYRVPECDVTKCFFVAVFGFQ